MRNRVAIYARVSTDVQSPETQLFELRQFCAQRNYTIVKEYVDTVSGNFYAPSRSVKRGAKQSGYTALMNDAQKKKFDIVLVWKYDRFSRNLNVLVESLNKFRFLGIDFISYTQNIDTTNAMGKLFFQIIGSFAEFERETIVERIKSGLARAKANGIKLGAPIRVTPGNIALIKQLRKEGQSFREISKAVKLSMGTVSAVLKM
jgi:DNA invertase Pin-like site-specific DNA recombinase